LLGGDERTEWIRRLDEAGIAAGPRGRVMKVRVTAKDIKDQKDTLSNLLAAAEKNSLS
jgi:hypothetical protein